MGAGRALVLLVVLGVAAGSAGPLPTLARPLTVVSDTSWDVTDSAGAYLGRAQNVCLDDTTPASCPLQAVPPEPATVYGYTLGGWSASMPATPSTPRWIWAPDITGDTFPAENTEYTFTTEFEFCGVPSTIPGDNIITLSADNEADVYVNNVLVLSNSNNATPSSVQVAPTHLQQFMNEIRIVARNYNNPTGCGQGPMQTDERYSCNPAGVVFSGRFNDALTSYPDCPERAPSTRTHPYGTKLDVGPCPADWEGERYKICGCGGQFGPIINTCTRRARQEVCLRFEQPSPGTIYGLGAMDRPGDLAFTEQGIVARVQTLENPRIVTDPTALPLFGDAVIEGSSFLATGGQSLGFVNVVMRFDFSALPFAPTYVSFDFSYRGGEYHLNLGPAPMTPLRIRNDLMYPIMERTGSPRPLVLSVGPYTIERDEVISLSPPGTAVRQEGTIAIEGGGPRWLEIGGQEMSIDNVCIANRAPQN